MTVAVAAEEFRHMAQDAIERAEGINLEIEEASSWR